MPKPNIHFKEIGEADAELLVEWLPRHIWPYHAQARVDEEWVRRRVAAGGFFGPDAKSFWVMEADQIHPVALVRVFDLTDITPLVDLRVANEARGRGVGTEALRWITRFVFTTFQETERLGGYTRHDNLAMVAVFKKCGYVQEAYHRKSWRVESGSLADSVGFSILRSDWLNGTMTPLPWRPQ